MRGRLLKLQHSAMVEPIHFVQPFDRRRDGVRAGGDYNVGRRKFERFAVGKSNFQGARPDEFCRRAQNRDARRCTERVFDGFAEIFDQISRARLNGGHIDFDARNHDAQVGGLARVLGAFGAGDVGFGRRATAIHAGAAHRFFFDDGDGLPAFGQHSGERAALSAADDNRIELSLARVIGA